MMTISTSAANTTGRHLDDGSRPSGKYSGISTENGIRAGWYTQDLQPQREFRPRQ